MLRRSSTPWVTSFLALIVLVSGCGHTSALTRVKVGCRIHASDSHAVLPAYAKAWPLYRSDLFQFRYPPYLHTGPSAAIGQFGSMVVSLSNQRMQRPCHTIRTTQGQQERCRPPVTNLQPGGIVMTWDTISSFGEQCVPHHSTFPGKVVQVAGLPAGVQVTAGDLGVAHSDRGMSMNLDGATSGHDIQMNAWMREPGRHRMMRDVLTMLRSLRLNRAGKMLLGTIPQYAYVKR